MQESREAELLNIVLPLPISRPLTYLLDQQTSLPSRGCRVLVPVGRRNMVGIVWGKTDITPEGIELRKVIRILDQVPLLPDSLQELLQWASSYYFYPIGQAVSEALPPGLLSARQKGIEKIISGKRRKGSRPPDFKGWEEAPESLRLTVYQQKACSFIFPALEQKKYLPLLLHGVTGSGKTEVYLRAARRCLELGRQALIMVPEISMTAQTVGRFTSRFGSEVTVLHSGLTDAQRREQWEKIRCGQSRCVVGTRSAVFAPLENLGLIVVDEEHDPSYKQESRLRYQARDLAIVRARSQNAVVVLGSATPCAASLWNVRTGRYTLMELPQRVAESTPPRIEIVDRRSKKSAKDRKTAGPQWLSRELLEAMKHTLSQGQQVLLFLNRRGYASFTFCTECGYVFKCRNCDVSLTYHQSRSGKSSKGEMLCHYCGYSIPAVPLCPKCGGQAVQASGFGTERVIEDLNEMFPGIKTGRLDRDTAGSRQRMQALLKDFHSGKIQILVGTQMVSKGHDFPGLTLVGVLWADLSLNLPEFHAAERTFQLLVQVAGRAGRRKLPGRVIIQTYMPDHYVFECIKTQNYEDFYEKELSLRKNLSYPPCGRLINLKFSGKNKSKVMEKASQTASLARSIARRLDNKSVEILGPAPAPMLRLKNRYRYQVLLKSVDIKALRQLCNSLISRDPEPFSGSVRLEVDVDPLSLL